MLDYDGTLSPFTPDRDHAVPYPGIPELLAKIHYTNKTRLIVISGRSIKILRGLLNLPVDIELWGEHGAERYSPTTRYSTKELPESAQELFNDISKWMNEKNILEHLETKNNSIALHWRGLSEKEKLVLQQMFLTRWGKKIRQSGLVLYNFDGGIEIKSNDASKGNAVKNILAQNKNPFIAAYLGDDLTDEDAFEVLGEDGLKVLVRKELRQTKADIMLEPPEELFVFLNRWLEMISQ